MEASFSGLLRWLLLGIGVLVVAGVYWVSRRAGGGKTPAAQREPPVPPREDPEHVADPPLKEPAARQIEEHREEPAAAPAAAPRVAQTGRHDDFTAAPGHTLEDKLLVLHVRSKSPHQFAGADILRIAEQAGLERAAGSDGGVFRRRAPGSTAASTEPPLFYLANMFSPGEFEWAGMETFSTTGLSLFAQLPGALTPPETFDELLRCARLFADGLHGAVLDESRSDLTVQTIRHLREELQAYAMGRAAPGTKK